MYCKSNNLYRSSVFINNKSSSGTKINFAIQMEYLSSYLPAESVISGIQNKFAKGSHSEIDERKFLRHYGLKC